MKIEDPEQLQQDLPPDGKVDATEVSESSTAKPSLIGRVLPWLIGLGVIGGIGWLVYSRIMASMMMQGFPQGPMPVSLASPDIKTVRDTSDYLATLESRQAITVQPQTQGRVTQILVQSGDRVAAGAPLMRLDSATQRAQVSGSVAAINAAKADLAAAQAEAAGARQTLAALQATRTSRQSDLEFNQAEFERFKTLAAQGAISQQQLDQQRNAFQQAEASLAQMDAQIQSQKAAIERTQAAIIRNQQQRDQAIATARQDQVQLQYTSVAAPIAGMVGDIPAKVGDLVDLTTPLLTLVQNQQVEINIQVPQNKADQMRVGLPVQLLSQSGKVMQSGSIFFIGPTVDPQTQSIQAKAVFSNPNGQLRTNQMVQARIIWRSRSGLVVPTTAISRLAGQSFVFTAVPPAQASCEASGPPGGPGGPPPGTEAPPPELLAVQKAVQLGQIVGNQQEITKGLKRGDRVITSGLMQLQDCMPIQAGPPPTA